MRFIICPISPIICTINSKDDDAKMENTSRKQSKDDDAKMENTCRKQSKDDDAKMENTSRKQSSWELLQYH